MIRTELSENSGSAMIQNESEIVKLDEFGESDTIDWDRLRRDIRQDRETFKERLARKVRENPFVPIGCGATVSALGYGIWSFYKGDRMMSQYMMRARVGAQAFTVFVLVAGVLYRKKKRTPASS